MKITWITFGLGWLAIIGFPPFSGFWSKDKIIEAAFEGPAGSRGCSGSTALLGAGITAFYMTRLFFMTFHGERRWTDDVHPHESPLIMTIPMMVLAVGSAFARPDPRADRLHRRTGWSRSSVSRRGGAQRPARSPVITSVTLLLVGVGVALAYAMYLRQRVPVVAPAGSVADPGRAPATSTRTPSTSRCSCAPASTSPAPWSSSTTAASTAP